MFGAQIPPAAAVAILTPGDVRERRQYRNSGQLVG
jgi:hypothetical protein